MDEQQKSNVNWPALVVVVSIFSACTFILFALEKPEPPPVVRINPPTYVEEFPGQGWYVLETWGDISPENLNLMSVRPAFLSSVEAWEAYRFGECLQDPDLGDYILNRTKEVRYDTREEAMAQAERLASWYLNLNKEGERR